MKKRKTAVKLAKVDPNYSGEAKKYSKPVASRDFLLKILKDHGGPLTLEQFIDYFEVHGDEESIEGLRRRLGAMTRDGQLVRNRRGGFVPLSNSDLIHGRISAHPDGFGFLVPDEGGDDIFISGKEMRQVLHGDRAVVCLTGVDHRRRKQGRIVDVLERANAQLVGRFHTERGIPFVLADNKRIHQEILLPPDGAGKAKEGDIVLVEIVEQPTKRHQPVGRVLDVLGAHMMPGMEIEVSIHSHGIPAKWPDMVVGESKAFGDSVLESDKQGRKDVRKLPLVTIDGEDAKDFDDAVYCSRTQNGWRLLVAIADVSHYVTPGSALDEEARNRGTSVYFPGRVIPMLPESLSNGLCSLNPDVDRLCLLCELSINRDGQITRSGFSKAVMRSHARLTYTQVAAMLIDKDPALRKQYKPLVK
ncbi:MAG: VacB/RNase II family 3'-5' exoribonuclease, partial [Gammaproteobacteria bacterium]|nr:VacB/RNase II family 3'-5' exoribonuclease [Gammaproteobacteria bacterium]